jgi:replicative DNA helicase/DNA primase
MKGMIVITYSAKHKINYNDWMLNYLNTTDYYNSKFFKCRNPMHHDNKPSMSYNPKRNNVHCFSCGATYGLIDLIKIDFNYDYTQAIKYIHSNLIQDEPINISVNARQSPTTSFSKKVEYNYDYLKKRGINANLQMMLNITWDSYRKCIIIPTSKYTYTERFTEGDFRYKHIGSIELYKPFYRLKLPSIIVEGEIDAISLYEAMGVKSLSDMRNVKANVIALGSANNWHKLANSNIDNLILALDNDDAGREATIKLSQELLKQGKTYKIVNLYGIYKDANECLINDREYLTKEVSKCLVNG